MSSVTPLFLNNLNLLTWPKAMVEYLLEIPDLDITIVDNASTYPPLLEWYEKCPVKVIRLNPGRGPRAPFGFVPPDRRFIVTDPDFDLSQVPKDFLQVLHSGLDKYQHFCKCGLSMEIEDLPENAVMGKDPRILEKGHWEKRIDGQYFDADIDTTFALYRARNVPCTYGPALRTDRPYTMRHLSWYMTPDTMTEEYQYYLENLDPKYVTGLVWSIRMRERLGMPNY